MAITLAGVSGADLDANDFTVTDADQTIIGTEFDDGNGAKVTPGGFPG